MSIALKQSASLNFTAQARSDFLKFRVLETHKTSKTIYDDLDHANRRIRPPVVF